MKLTFHEDCGHAWLEVPVETFLKAPVNVSSFSYYEKHTRKLYLEEDCDAGDFLDAMQAKGIEIKFNNKHHGENCFIRRLDRVSDHLIFRLKQLGQGGWTNQ